MEVKTLYRYDRGNGKITVTPEKPDCEHTEVHRLIADEGKILVKGNERTTCIDVDTTDEWKETDDVEHKNR